MNPQELRKTGEPRRIGIDGRVLQDPKPSGISQYAYNIIKELSSIDRKNQYIIFYNSFREVENIVPTFGDNFQSRTYHFPNKILEWLWKVIPYPKIDRVLNVDVFFSPHFINIPLTKKVNKTVTIHDLSFIKNKNYFSWRKNLWHWQMSPKKMCKSFDKIVAVSDSTKHDLSRIYKIDEGKIKTIYNGARKIIDLFPDEDNELNFLKKLNIEKKKYILFLATLEPRKNITGLLDAFNLIKEKANLKLVIAGKKGWLFKNIFKKTENYDLEQKVVFTDFINEEEKHMLFKNCSLFVFPSFYEGFGIPVIEAANYKVPIITSSSSSIPEIIKDSAILINPHNINDLARAILEVTNKKQLQNLLIKKENGTNDYSWRESARKTLDYILS